PVNAVTLGCEMARGEFFTLLKRGEPLEASTSKRFVFYCTDPRDGCANFIFARKNEDTDGTVSPTGEIMQLPIATERPTALRDIDRIIVRSSVTEDATLLIDAQHTGLGHTAQHEIADISFGLNLQ
ncbi:MAG: hypothetical protein WCG52_10390, partial [bacterium]